MVEVPDVVQSQKCDGCLDRFYAAGTSALVFWCVQDHCDTSDGAISVGMQQEWTYCCSDVDLYVSTGDSGLRAAGGCMRACGR